MVLDSLSTLPWLSSLRIFLYDLPKTIEDENRPVIAKVASLVSDFGLCFRRKFSTPDDDKLIGPIFEDNKKFIDQLFRDILLSSANKQPYGSLEDDGCGLTMWF